MEWDEGSRTISISDPSEEGETNHVAAKLTLDKEEYSANDVLQLTLKNEGSSPISFGSPYRVEYLKDGDWENWPMDDIFFTMELNILMENEIYTQKINLSQLGVEEGTYRIIKSISDEEHKTTVELHSDFEVKTEITTLNESIV